MRGFDYMFYNLKKELNEYLELIEYDEKQVFDELAKKTFDDIKNKKI